MCFSQMSKLQDELIYFVLFEFMTIFTVKPLPLIIIGVIDLHLLSSISTAFVFRCHVVVNCFCCITQYLNKVT